MTWNSATKTNNTAVDNIITNLSSRLQTEPANIIFEDRNSLSIIINTKFRLNLK